MVRAFEAGKLKFCCTNPRDRELNHWKIVER
jgi:hypothetical protein